MKLSIVAVACIARLPLYARPAANSAEKWGGGSEEVEEKWVDEDCSRKEVTVQMPDSCTPPGVRKSKEYQCKDCGIGWLDTWPRCDLECCDPGRLLPNGFCGCTHAGEPYTVGILPNDTSKCCGMGYYGPQFTYFGRCGCTDVGFVSQYGAAETDCCSGKWDNATTNHTCIKAPAGHVHPWLRPQDCITGDVVDTEKGKACAMGEAGDPVYKASGCISGKMDEHGVCLCIHAGIEHEKPEACCSGRHDNGTKTCACMDSDSHLHHGAVAADCCSEVAEGGKCLCQRPGGPIKAGREEACCAMHAVKHGNHSHCGCVKPGTQVKPEFASACCGGFYNEHNGTCDCITADFLVAGFVEKDSCCSGEFEHHDNNTHCKGKPVPIMVAPEPIVRVYR